MKTLYISILLSCMLMPSMLFAQEQVQGTVTDYNGLPLPGVNIMIKNSTVGTVTNFDGQYTLQNIEPQDTIVYTSIGFKKEEVVYAGQLQIDVQLQKSVAALDQVVIIGYGSANKAEATGAYSQVSTKEFNKGAIVSPTELISGKVAGVRITSSGGGVGGEGQSIRIRGGSSLSANNSPLIVVDGMPLDQRGTQGVRNQLSAINPENIKEFTILKDAAATAIYGSRASNGVVIITTKNGSRNQDWKVNIDAKLGVSTVADYVDVLNADQFRTLLADQQGVDLALLGNANTDWQKKIYQTGIKHIENVTVSKGFNDFYFRFNYNHTSEKGVLKEDAYERNGIDLSMTQFLLDNNLKLDLNVKGNIDVNHFADQGAIGAAIEFDPTQNVYDDSLPFGGFFEFHRTNDQGQIVPQTEATLNPLALLKLNHNKATNKRVISNFKAEYRFPFLPELKATVNAGLDYSELEGLQTRPVYAAANLQDIPYMNDYSGFNRNQLLDVYFNYNKTFDKLKVDVTAGHSYQEFFILSNRVYTDSNDTLADPTSRNRNSLESYFARASFSFDNKYLLSASYRYDGSSRFADKWSSFPSVSVGWNLKEEDFLKTSDVLSALKIRAGYGVTGNNAIGRNYGYFGIYTQGQIRAQYPFGDSYYHTLRPEAYDANLKWEELSTYNAGVDFGFLNNRLNGSVDVYYRETSDLLAEVPVPAGANLSDRIITNIGQTVSKGVEIGLNGLVIDTDKFTWDLSYNISFQDLEITKLSLGENPNFFIPKGGISGGVGNTIQIWKKGYDPSTFFVFEQDYDDAGKPIEGAYVDQNNDGQITEADKRPYKKATPDYFMGLTSNMSYKNFNLSFTLRGSFNNYVYNNTASSNGFINSGIINPSPYYSNLNPSVLKTNFVSSQMFSDYYVEKANFVKLDNVSLSYLFPGDKFNIRASFTATNVFTISDYSGVDPEVDSGIDNNLYPRTRSYVLGLNVSF